MSENVSTVGCTVDVFPWELPAVSLSGSQIISCDVNKSIVGGAAGTFSILLPPGGPNGVEDPDTWSEIITPGSLAVIAMSRGSRAAVTMVGIVQDTSEALTWTANGVIRRQVVQGLDFTYFFSLFMYTAFSALGIFTATELGAALDIPEAGPMALMSPALFGVLTGSASTPVFVAQALFQFMLAPGGLMGETRVPWMGSRLTLSQCIGSVWENYLCPVFFGNFLLGTEESWMAKIQECLPSPLYEVFCISAPQGSYSLLPVAQGGSGTAIAPPPPPLPPNTIEVNGASIPQVTAVAKAPTANGFYFASASMPQATPAAPMLIARVNPTVALPLTVRNNNDSGTFGAPDMSRWNALPLYTPDSGVISSSLSFSSRMAKNFYALDPGWVQSNMMPTGTNVTPAFYLFMVGADAASIHRFGYRPCTPASDSGGNFLWIFDPIAAGIVAPAGQWWQSVATIWTRLASWHHPLPLMGRSNVVLPLRVDILPGCKFEFTPSKFSTPWTGYIESVSHHFEFGGKSVSTTTLGVSRLLPTAVYQASGPGGLLQAIQLGNATRSVDDPGAIGSIDGYSIGLPQGLGPALQTIVPLASNAALAQFIGGIASAYVTPQS